MVSFHESGAAGLDDRRPVICQLVMEVIEEKHGASRMGRSGFAGVIGPQKVLPFAVEPLGSGGKPRRLAWIDRGRQHSGKSLPVTAAAMPAARHRGGEQVDHLS
jgi:hypothetical protein